MPNWPQLDPAIDVLDGTEVVSAWDRFEVFEALHHSMKICNPMTNDELNAAIDVVDVHGNDDVLDVACGYGELLLRLAERAPISATGIDLSPWMIRTAHEQARGRLPDGTIRWILGEARVFRPQAPPTVVACVGAEWVWHDFNGTARALAGMVAPMGKVVIGAARLHTAANQDEIADQHGRVDTIDDQAHMLGAHGLKPVHRIDPDDAAWDAYLHRTAAAAQLWRETNPGERAEAWVEEQADWQAARERDRHIIGWSLWIAERTPTVVC